MIKIKATFSFLFNEPYILLFGMEKRLHLVFYFTLSSGLMFQGSGGGRNELSLSPKPTSPSIVGKKDASDGMQEDPGMAAPNSFIFLSLFQPQPT
jgi:hypothetical protein